MQDNPNSPQGIVLIDKPADLTSHDVVDQVRRRLGVRRVGHAGTLDPFATGLLIVLVGRSYTKRQSEFLKQDKSYLVTAQLGTVTETYDRTGQLIAQADSSVLSGLTSEQIRSTMSEFVGEYEQQVPLYSAVKISGQKLYQVARKAGSLANWQQLQAAAPRRQVIIKSIEQFNYDPATYQVQFVVGCGSGTYIRSLVYDLGVKLGVGASVNELRRLSIGQWLVSQAVSLSGLTAKDLLQI